MSSSSRYLAFFSYLFSLPGALYVLLARRGDAFAVFHARQSLVQVIIGIATPIIWIVISWLLVWVPVVGGLISICLFALMIAIWIVVFVDWILGMSYALKGRVRRTPVAGPIALRRPPSAPVMPKETTEPTSELLERTSISDV